MGRSDNVRPGTGVELLLADILDELRDLHASLRVGVEVAPATSGEVPLVEAAAKPAPAARRKVTRKRTTKNTPRKKP